MTASGDDLARALGRVEGAIEGLREGQEKLEESLLTQMEAKHRENQQQNLSARETLERIERYANDGARRCDNALTKVRVDLEKILDGHDVRIVALEQVESRRQWLRTLLQKRLTPITALLFGGVGTAVGIGVTRLLS